MPEEKRYDPSDWRAYTFEEIKSFYSDAYTKSVIKAYWDYECLTAAKQLRPSLGRDGRGGKGASWQAKREPAKKEPEPEIAASGLCVAGEALIDFLPATTVSGDAAYRGVPGGSPFNCCIAAKRLGIPVTFLGALSTDLFGEALYGHLAREGVDMRMVTRLDKPSTLAFVSRSQGEGEKYAFFKENAADRSLTKSLVAKAVAGCRFRGMHVSLGAVTLEHGPSADAFAALFRAGGKQGALRSFDPNLRPNMIKGGAESYSRRIERFLTLVDLAKTSEEDVSFLYGEGAEVPALAAKWLKIGPKLVVITRGAEGAVAYVPQEEGADPAALTVPAPGEGPSTIDAEGKSVPVVDTVGAGDTFMGGLLSGCLGTGAPGGASLLPQLLGEKPWDAEALEGLRAVLRFAAACAAVTCSRAGADPPTAAEAERALGALGAAASP